MIGIFQKIYISRCSQSGDSLTAPQINELEKTVSELFGKRDMPITHSYNYVDKDILLEAGEQNQYKYPLRILTAFWLHSLSYYSEEMYGGHKLNSAGEVTDRHLIVSYNKMLNQVKSRQCRTKNTINGILNRDSIKRIKPRGISYDGLKIIEDYLFMKSLISKKEL